MTDRAAPRRILHVAEAPLGGVISCLEEILHDQVTRDLDAIEVVTPEINGEALAEIDSTILRLTTLPHARGSLRGPLALARLTVARARALDPDIIHVHSTVAGLVVRGCRHLLPRRARIVYCPHSWAFSRAGSAAKNRAIAAVERHLSRGTDAIVCVSAYERRDAIAVGIDPEKAVVIENGIRPVPAPPAVERDIAGPKTVVFAGRFDRQKGFDTFAGVMRHLGDEARGVAIGRAIIEAGTPEELPDNVRLAGWQPRAGVRAELAQADLLLMPSRWEGLPMVALEAMQAGVAIYASRVGGLQDVVVEGETGHLFAPDDSGAIANCIRSTDRGTLRRQGAAGRARFLARYTAERMNALLWDLYCDLMARPPAR